MHHTDQTHTRKTGPLPKFPQTFGPGNSAPLFKAIHHRITKQQTTQMCTKAHFDPRDGSGSLLAQKHLYFSEVTVFFM